MSIIPWKTAKQYQSGNTRQVTLPDGKLAKVYMPPSLWVQYESLIGLEDLVEADIVELALDEREAQRKAGVKATFSTCFRLVVTVRVLDWFRVAEEMGVTSDNL
ncbi:hypothetical protein [Rhodopirellula europaea]|uniref:hypothetical protein n=1 Tax=Rhodopirellula europaea TaxID=1263866 RepID=UPI003D2C81C8